MRLPTLDSDSAVSLYRQLYEELRRDLLSGSIPAGMRLPSKRTLSSLLGISVNTVDAAYQQLVSEGYLEAHAKSGYFACDLGTHASLSVTSIDEAAAGGEAGQYSSKQQLPLPVSEDSPGITDRAAPEMIDFSPNGVDLSALPLSTFKKAIRDVLEEEGVNAFRSCDSQGAESLREALCRYVRESRGLACDPGQIIIGAGTDYILQLLVQIMRSVHEIWAVAMENPVYNKAYQIFTGLQVPVELIPLDKYGIHMGRLASSSADLVYTTPSHQFPLGIIMPVSRRTELLSWAAGAPHRYIIEDDYDSEFRYAGRPIPAISGMDANSKVIYLGTFSKSIAPSIRISYLVVPPALLKAFKKNLSYFNTTVTHPEQLILARFIACGDFERHINHMRTLYRRKRDHFVQALSPYMDKLVISGTDAGLHLLCHVKNGMSEDQLVRTAEIAGAKVYGISSYYLMDRAPAAGSTEAAKAAVADTSTDAAEAVAAAGEDVPKSTVLLGYAGLTDEGIVRGVAALAGAWVL